MIATARRESVAETTALGLPSNFLLTPDVVTSLKNSD